MSVSHTYPYTIENGAGERLTFIRRVQGPGGDRLEVENVVEPGGGPPMHVHHYRGEFGMTEIPRVVQRLAFPVIVTVGRLLGKHAKYAAAPEPVTR